MTDWLHFSLDELKCSHCGQCYMNPAFMTKLVKMREALEFPFFISSAYRCADHPDEAKKDSPGAHNTGRAVDILASGYQADLIVDHAKEHGFTRRGINQKGDHAQRFIHLDDLTAADDPKYGSPLWTY